MADKGRSFSFIAVTPEKAREMMSTLAEKITRYAVYTKRTCREGLWHIGLTYATLYHVGYHALLCAAACIPYLCLYSYLTQKRSGESNPADIQAYDNNLKAIYHVCGYVNNQ